MMAAKDKAYLNLLYIRGLGEVLSEVTGNLIELSPENVGALGDQVIRLVEQVSEAKAAYHQQDKTLKNLQIIKTLGKVLSLYADNPLDFSLDTLGGIGGQVEALSKETIEALEQMEQEAA